MGREAAVEEDVLMLQLAPLLINDNGHASELKGGWLVGGSP